MQRCLIYTADTFETCPFCLFRFRRACRSPIEKEGSISAEMPKTGMEATWKDGRMPPPSPYNTVRDIDV